MIAAPVQCDVDGISKGSHYVSVPPRNGLVHEWFMTEARMRGTKKGAP
ncbi:MAG: hypothetical protein QOD84_966, partial [Acidobacteriaceae bacterium]